MEDTTSSIGLPPALVRRRNAFLLLALAVLCAEIVWPIATWPAQRINFAFYLYKLGWLAAFILGCGFWIELFRFASRAGGCNYAAGYVLLSVLLSPGLLGILLVPALVVRDMRGGQAEWRRRNAPSVRERVLRSALYCACLGVLLPPLWLLHGQLAYAAPFLAFLLQRLVLPWCRRTPAAEHDGSVAG